MNMVVLKEWGKPWVFFGSLFGFFFLDLVVDFAWLLCVCVYVCIMRHKLALA